MKKIIIDNYIPSEINTFNHKHFNCKYKLNTINYLVTALNLLFCIYLLIQNNRTNLLYKELKSSLDEKNKENTLDLDESKFGQYQKIQIDRDMIGLKYPDISFDNCKDNLLKGKIISSLINFMTQLEIKLLYLEKEINVTKLNAFYTSRTLYLERKNVKYDDSNIKDFHHIMSWLVIHKSTQLKGIASDKYLGCKYASIKIGKDICPQRIGVYNSIEEIDFEKLLKMGNVILKISNGCHDNVFISENKTKNDLIKIKEEITYYFNRDYSFIVPEFFHSYSKKRIVLEKVFSPIEDLYEFKFMIFNNKIKMIILCYFKNNNNLMTYYDENFNSIKDSGKENFNVSLFDTISLNQMKIMAIKLSEDFPNFIRVDLYLYHNKIYLSELTFDSHSGIPIFEDIKYFNDEVRKWKRIDY